jgi:hypothetical protein
MVAPLTFSFAHRGELFTVVVYSGVPPKTVPAFAVDNLHHIAIHVTPHAVLDSQAESEPAVPPALATGIASPA